MFYLYIKHYLCIGKCVCVCVCFINLCGFVRYSPSPLEIARREGHIGALYANPIFSFWMIDM